MIAAIEGTLEYRGAAGIVVVKVGGFSFQVYVPSSTLGKLGDRGEKVSLYTHLHLRQDNIALYGFARREELELFKVLLGVGGVGPKVALGLISALSAEQLSLAIASGNTELLTQVPGVGNKTASRLVLELKGKLEKSWEGAYPADLNVQNAEIVAALTNLGYSVAEANQALASLPGSPALTLEEKLKRALQYFATK